MPEQDRSSVDRTRRDFLRVAGVTGIGIASAELLSACRGVGYNVADQSGVIGGSSTGTPRRGGTLRVGAQGGGNTDILDAQNPLTNADYARGAQLYDGLVQLGDQGQPELVLAESITPNKQATQYVIRLRPGILAHDGKPFTAQDVLYSFNRIVSNKFPGISSIGPVDLAGSRVADSRTLILNYHQPYSILVDQLSLIYFRMVPRGYDPNRPIGTGPFKLKSFTPGLQSVVERFDDYWDQPRPYLDSVVTININDETAQVNGLQSGQVDAIDYLSAGSVPALEATSSKVIISKTGAWGPFTMRVDQTPFSDNRVRLALKLVCDRPRMLKAVFGGYGTIGNDVFGIFDKRFDRHLPQRHQDIAQAKSLLKAAGHPDLSIQLITTANAPGQLQAAAVFKTQAAAAGITTSIVTQTPTDYFAKSYLTVPFSQDYWPYQPYLVVVSQDSVPGAPFSATKFDNPTYNALYKKAISTTDLAAQTDAVHEMLRIDYSDGGNIIPYYFPVIDAVGPHVFGVEPTVTGQALRNFQFKQFWIQR